VKKPAVRLTKTRAQWAAERSKPPTFEGLPLHYPAGVGVRYVKDLGSLTAQMTAQVNREVIRLFKGEAAQAFFAQDHAGKQAPVFPSLPMGSHEQPPSLFNVTFAQDARSVGSEARILVNSLQARFQDLFNKKAKILADRMVRGADKASASSTHSSLQKLSGGMSLKTNIMNASLSNIYKATVAENVGLIKSISSQYLDDVQGAVMRSITTGNGLADLIPALEKYEGQTHRRARNIALDQTRKAFNSINKGRMQAIGIKKYKWLHSGGGAHPREDHVEMDGNIYSFDDPPVIDERTGERGIPGQAINCRCTMLPVFVFEDEEKPQPETETAE
jgi:SPP1 gp7 family putative phage head morphogenesis protein